MVETNLKIKKKMYTVKNFKTKKALKAALAAGERLECFQPNGDITGSKCPLNGIVFLEGPHYPEPHRWYAQGTMKDGVLVSVK